MQTVEGKAPGRPSLGKVLFYSNSQYLFWPQAVDPSGERGTWWNRSREEAFENHRVSDEVAQNTPNQNTEFRVGQVCGIPDCSVAIQANVNICTHPDSWFLADLDFLKNLLQSGPKA